MSILAHGGGTSGATASIFVTGLTETDDVTASKDGRTWNGVWTTKTVIVEQPLIPAMTSNTTPSGVVSASSQYSSSYAPYLAMNGSKTSGEWASNGETSGCWITYTFADNHHYKLSHIELQNRGGGDYSYGRKVYGKNQDGTFDLLYEDNTSWTSDVYATYQISANKEYYGIKVEHTSGVYNPGFKYIQVYGEITSTVYGHIISKLNSYGTYTVTATDGTHTATESVLVDMAEEYDIEITSIPDGAIYWDGFIDGYSKNFLVSDNTNATWSVVENETDVEVTGYNSNAWGSTGNLFFTKPIPNVQATKLVIEYEVVTAGAYRGYLQISGSYTSFDILIAADIDLTIGEHIAELTLSGAWQGKYALINSSVASGSTTKIKINRAYVE